MRYPSLATREKTREKKKRILSAATDLLPAATTMVLIGQNDKNNEPAEEEICSSSLEGPLSQGGYLAGMTTLAAFSHNTALAINASMALAVFGFIFLTIAIYTRERHQPKLQQILPAGLSFTPDFSGANGSVDPCSDFHAYACGSSDRHPSSAALELRLASLLNISEPRMYEATLREKAESFYQSCVAGSPPPEGIRLWFQRLLNAVLPKGRFSGALLRPLFDLSLNYRLHLLLSFRCELRCGKLLLEELDHEDWMEHSLWLREDASTYEAFLSDALGQVLEQPSEAALSWVSRVKDIELSLEERFFRKPASSAAHAERYVINVSLASLNGKTPGLVNESWPDVFRSVMRPLLSTLVDVSSTRALASSVAVFDLLNFLSAFVPKVEDRGVFLRWLVARNLHVMHFEPLRRGLGIRVHCVRLCEAAMGAALALPFLPEIEAVVPRAKNLVRQMAHAFALRMHGPDAEVWMGVEGAEVASARVTNLRIEIAGESVARSEAFRSNLEPFYNGLGHLTPVFLTNWHRVTEALSANAASVDGLPWSMGLLTKRVIYSERGFRVSLRRIMAPISGFRSYYAASMAGANMLGSHLAVPAMMAFGTSTPLTAWSERVAARFSRRLQRIEKEFGVGAAVDMYARFAHVAALETAHDLYRRQQEEELSRSSFHGVESPTKYSLSQHFYYLWCRHTCHMHESSLCNVPLRNSYRFSAAFKCPHRSPMNPTDKCIFW